MSADVYRTTVGEIVSFPFTKGPRVGVVLSMEAEDALDLVTRLPTSKDGKRYGRMVLMDCRQSDCPRCSVPGRPPGFRDVWGNRWWGHYADECQLSFAGIFPMLENAPELKGGLF